MPLCFSWCWAMPSIISGSTLENCLIFSTPSSTCPAPGCYTVTDRAASLNRPAPTACAPTCPRCGNCCWPDALLPACAARLCRMCGGRQSRRMRCFADAARPASAAGWGSRPQPAGEHVCRAWRAVYLAQKNLPAMRGGFFVQSAVCPSTGRRQGLAQVPVQPEGVV